ncbi:MAG: tRNA (adenosine(37)-N6)-threonylcarbamoyltransferase complex dimerization subunit type 1 TsaB [Candidatus Latescibacterota bacterium]
MNIMAIDTSSREGAVCLSMDGEPSCVQHFGQKDSHLVALGSSMDSLLVRCRIDIQDIDRIAVVSGPGSFTGLRIGMAFVKGIHAALATDVVVMTSLQLLAHPHLDRDRLVCPMIDARKSEVYTALYRLGNASAGWSGEPVLSERVVSPRKLLAEIESTVEGPVLFAGSGVPCYRDVIESSKIQKSFAGEESNRISLPEFTRLAAALTPLSSEEILTLEPFYIRSSDAELKLLKSHRTHERN